MRLFIFLIMASPIGAYRVSCGELGEFITMTDMLLNEAHHSYIVGGGGAGGAGGCTYDQVHVTSGECKHSTRRCVGFQSV